METVFYRELRDGIVLDHNGVGPVGYDAPTPVLILNAKRPASGALFMCPKMAQRLLPLTLNPPVRI